MKKAIFGIVLMMGFLWLTAPSAHGEDFFFSIELLRGPGGPDLFQEASVAAFSILPLSSVTPAQAEPTGPRRGPDWDIRKNIMSLYHLDALAGLYAGSWAWDESKSSLPGFVAFDETTFHLNLLPRFLPPKQMRLRVQLSAPGIRPRPAEKILDVDLIAPLDDPVVTGFDYRGQSYFLSLRVTKRTPLKPGTAGAARKASEPSKIPAPVHMTQPRYPKSLSGQKVEGELLLRVTIGSDGRVTDVQVLKSLHPEIDRETVQAVGGWTFETSQPKPGSAPATYALSFQFGQNAQFFPADAEEEPEKQAATPPSPAAAGSLGRILEACAEYCRKLNAAALDFVCQEKISEEIYDYVPVYDIGSSDTFTLNAMKKLTQKASYLYDYQMIKTREGIREDRTLLEENGRPLKQVHALLKTKRFFSYRSLLAPVGLFSRERQPLFSYRIVGEDVLRGKKAWVIEVFPLSDADPSSPYGKAWVEKETFRIFKLEVDARSLAGYDKALQAYDLSQVTPFLTTSHLYETEKNGILFPSQTVFKEAFTVKSARPRRIQRSKTEIIFSRYRFFTVETETVYKD